MSIIETLILSVIEGITEFLPISSTGHLVLATRLLSIEQTAFVKSFEIIIQLGAILAIVSLYWKTLLENKDIWLKILAAFLPTAVIGYIFYDVIKKTLLGNELITVLALLFGGIFLIVLEYLHKEKESHTMNIANISLQKAFLIGVFQSISIIPGVSRAAATIIGALFLGTKRKTAVEFSFLLAIPTMSAASGLDLLRTHLSFRGEEYALLAIGFIGSFLTALIVVKYFLKYITKHTFIPFGIYRIILAVLFLLFVL